MTNHRDIDDDDGLYDDETELDEFDEATANCHGYFQSQKASAAFVCGAVGSEDCDECPLHRWLGLTNKEIDGLEESDNE
jgi:hypothetical protein